MLPLEDGVPGHDGGPAARGRRGGGAPCPRPRDAQPLGLEADLVPHPQPALGRGGARPRHRQRHPHSQCRKPCKRRQQSDIQGAPGP